MANVRNATISGSDETLVTGSGHYFGFTLRETGGSNSATVVIYDNTASSGTVLDTISLAPGESAREWYTPFGIRFGTGIRIDVGGSGTVEGAIRVG